MLKQLKTMHEDAKRDLGFCAYIVLVFLVPVFVIGRIFGAFKDDIQKGD